MRANTITNAPASNALRDTFGSRRLPMSKTVLIGCYPPVPPGVMNGAGSRAPAPPRARGGGGGARGRGGGAGGGGGGGARGAGGGRGGGGGGGGGRVPAV